MSPCSFLKPFRVWNNGRLQRTWTNNPALRLPQNSSPLLNSCTNLQNDIFHPPVPPSWTQLCSDLFLPPPSLLNHTLPQPCATYYQIYLGVFGAPLWLLIKAHQSVEVSSFSFSSILASLNSLNLTKCRAWFLVANNKHFESSHIFTRNYLARILLIFLKIYLLPF
jgi:hypothetical protein